MLTFLLHYARMLEGKDNSSLDSIEGQGISQQQLESELYMDVWLFKGANWQADELEMFMARNSLPEHPDEIKAQKVELLDSLSVQERYTRSSVLQVRSSLYLLDSLDKNGQNIDDKIEDFQTAALNTLQGTSLSISDIAERFAINNERLSDTSKLKLEPPQYKDDLDYQIS